MLWLPASLPARSLRLARPAAVALLAMLPSPNPVRSSGREIHATVHAHARNGRYLTLLGKAMFCHLA